MLRKTIIKANAGKHTLWVAQSYLRQVASGISEEYFWKVRSLATKSKTAGWQWCKIDGDYYYDYATIPDRAPKHYRSLLPSSEELTRMARQPFNDTEVLERAAMLMEQDVAAFFKKEDITWFMYESSPCFAYERAHELAQGLAWARLLWQVVKADRYIRYGINSIMQGYEVGAGIMKAKQLYGMRTGTAASLRNKLTEFPATADAVTQRQSMISGKFGNDNRRIVGTAQVIDPETGELMPFDAHQAVMFALYMNIGYANKQYKNTLYRERYINMMTEMGHTPVSYRTFCTHTDEVYNKMLMTKERDGDKAFNSLYKTYVPCLPLQFSNSLWVADGSGTKLQYLAASPDPSKGGEKAQKGTGVKVKTLYMVRINDVASQALIGYAISETGENDTMVRNALKMAVDAADGFLPLDFLSDNGGSFTGADIKSRLTVLLPHVRTITVGNSQENIAETFVRLFTEMGRSIENWSGTGYNAKTLQHQPNSDYQHIDKLPSRDEAYAQMYALIDKWNNTITVNGQTRMERFKAARHTESATHTPRTYRYAFGHTTEIELSRYRGFVSVNHDGTRYLFTVENYETELQRISAALGNKGDAKIQVRWNETGADLYTPAGAFLLECLPTEKAHKSHAEATPETWDALQKLARRKKAMNDAADNMVQKVAASVSVALTDGSTTAEEPYSEPMTYEAMVAYAPKKRVKNEYNAQMDAEQAAAVGGSIPKMSIEDEALNAI